MALLILATSLTTIIGLQSSIMQSSLRDQRRTTAMLFARRILAHIESTKGTPESRSFSGQAVDLLRQEIPNDKDDQEYYNSLENFRVQFDVQSWSVDLPLTDAAGDPLPIPQDAIKRVSLLINWGESQSDTMEVVYFLPGSGDVT